MRILWEQLLAWLGGVAASPEAPAQPVFSQADLEAIAAMNAPPKEGWYAWECAQYRASGAFWFDPRRYDGTTLAYHRPSTDDLVANYSGSYAEAIADYGRDEADVATWWVYKRGFDGHLQSLDPIGWCVATYRAHGSPRVRGVPQGWSLEADIARSAQLTGQISNHYASYQQSALSAYANRA